MLVQYLPYVRDAGFHFDDWRYQAVWRATGWSGYAAGLQADGLHPRPGHLVYFPLRYELLGSRFGATHALDALIVLGTGLALAAYLRLAGVARWAAAATAVLWALFPWTTAVRAWAVLSVNTLGLGLFLAGSALSLARPHDRRARIAGLALVAAGIACYEQFALLVVLTAGLLWRRAGWRHAVLELAVAAPVTWWTVRDSDSPRTPDPVHHAITLAGDAVELLGRMLPGGTVVAVAIVGVGLLRARDPGVRRWLLLVGVALAAIVLGYATLVPAADFYTPLQPGEGERSNAGAAPGWALLVVALAGLAASAVTSRARVPLALALVAAVAIPWVGRSRERFDAWESAAAMQAQVLDVVARSNPPGDAVVLVYGTARDWAPGVLAFVKPTDLTEALRVRFGEPGLSGAPVYAGATVECRREAAVLSAPYLSEPVVAPYGRARFADTTTGLVHAVPDASTCRALTATLPIGPLWLHPDS